MHSLPALPPLDGLLAVAAAARTGSFTDAAEQLGLTHGAVSRRVQVVEAWLGTALFERHARGARLTPAGQRFVRSIEQALGTIARAAEQWRPHRGVHTLRISVVPSFARLWLVPRLAALQGNPPDLFLDVTIDHRVVDLGDDEVDVAIRYGAGSWPDLQATLLFREQLVPVAAPALASSLGRDAAPGLILQHPLLHDSDASQWRSWLALEGLTYRPRVVDRRFEDYDLVLEAAAAGVAVALLRLPLAGTWLDTGRLCRISSRALDNPSAHFIVHRPGDVRPQVQQLVSRLLAEANASQALRS